ncbi:hypothetical protein [Zavarzinella formosa]|uniref:hypothetical protein n=1 Tax=Zavarzinella formosa TaxID=360055 RepID=UPI0002E31070|nr:hypothetical protein [Zavarzinella formosa]
MSDLSIDDDGFVSVVINQAEINIDLYAAHNRLIDIRQTVEAAGEEKPAPSENQLIADYVESLGFPRVSHRAAVKFANAIFDRVGELRKKDVSASSASTSAD